MEFYLGRRLYHRVVFLPIHVRHMQIFRLLCQAIEMLEKVEKLSYISISLGVKV